MQSSRQQWAPRPTSEQRSLTPATPLLFVEDGVDGKRHSKQARSHVARVIRQRKRSRPNQSRRGSPVPEVDSADGSQLSLALQQRHKLALQHASASSVPQTLSPVFGALRTSSFSVGDQSEVADIADFCFNRLMDGWLDPKHKPAWMAAFFDSPLVFNCLAYSCGVIQDITSQRAVGPKRLTHLIRTIQLVNNQLGQIDAVDPEPIMLAIITLWRINLDQIAAQHEVSLLFRPHARSTSWVNVFGRLGGDDSHCVALVQLVERVGGLGNFTTLPGLQESLALADVLDSSARAKRPRFESIWNAQHVLAALDPLSQRMSGDAEGSGFHGILPASAAIVLNRLAVLDKLLDDFSTRSASYAENVLVAVLANAVQHDLLSLPPWHNLPEEEQESSIPIIYECCRVSAILYSNSVIFPIAAQDEWLETLLRHLTHLINLINIEVMVGDMPSVVLWSLFVGSMAGFWTSHRAFFLNKLKQMLAVMTVKSLDHAKVILRQFLWRKTTCEDGTNMLWTAMNLEANLCPLPP